MLKEERPLPPVLYKYFPVESWLPQLLTGESLKFSSRATFNDPFDSRPPYKISARDEARTWVKSKVAHIRNPSMRLLQQQKILSQSGKVRSFGQEENDRVLDGIGILCLSETWNNPILWAHYAQKHCGICVGFYSDVDVFQLAEPVMYSPVRPIIERPRDSNQEMVEKAFFTKDSCWAVEAEWRILKRKLTPEEQRIEAEQLGYLDHDQRRLLSEHRGAGTYQFNPAAVESVTKGMKITPRDEKTVLQAVRSVAPRVPVYRALPNADKYPLARRSVRLSHDPHLKRA